MPHQAVDLIHRNNTWLLINQAVAANGAQHLRIGQCLQDGITFEIVKTEHTRSDPVPAAACEVNVGGAIEKGCPRPAAGAKSRDFIGEVFGNFLNRGFIAQAAQHIADYITGRGDVRRNTHKIGKALVK